VEGTDFDMQNATKNTILFTEGKGGLKESLSLSLSLSLSPSLPPPFPFPSPPLWYPSHVCLVTLLHQPTEVLGSLFASSIKALLRFSYGSLKVSVAFLSCNVRASGRLTHSSHPHVYSMHPVRRNRLSGARQRVSMK
jgi:hypothetical protein